MKLFRNKNRQSEENPTDMRWWLICGLVKGLSKPNYDKLKEAMDLAWEAYRKCKNVKTPDEIIDEAGGFLLHQKDGVAK